MTPAERVIDFLRGEGHDPEPYKGRGMHTECVSFRTERVEHVLWDLARGSMDAGLDLVAPTTDSMGSGTVVYWPRLEWPETTR